MRTSEVKPLLKLAIPISSSLLANMAMQLVDTMFVGRLGAEAIGGVSIGNAAFVTLMVVGIGILLGLDFMISHAFGRKDFDDCNRSLIQGLYVTAAISIVATVILWFAPVTFEAFGIDSGISRQAGIYLRTLCWSLLPFLLFNTFRQYLQAMGVAMPVLIILVLGNLVNAVANYTFVFGNFGSPAFGIGGSGAATFVARLFMLICIFIYVLRRDKKLRLGLRAVSRKFSSKKSMDLLRLGTPAGVQMFLEVGVFTAATMLVGRLGAIPLAAHQVVLHIASFAFMVPLGLSSAAAVRVGQTLGEGNRPRAIRIGWSAIAVGAAFMSCSGVTLYLLSDILLRAFTIDDQVIALGQSLLLVAAFFQLSDGIQVVTTGALRGVGNTRASMLANLAGHWIFGLPIGSALCFAVGWGAQGLWVGLSIGLTFVAAVLLFVWWKKTKDVRHA